MLRSRAITIIKRGMGFRRNSSSRPLSIAALKQVQTGLRRRRYDA